MVTRLLDWCRTQRRPWLDCLNSLRAYDVDAVALRQCRRKLLQLLQAVDVSAIDAEVLFNAWLVEADYLLLIGRTIPGVNRPPQLFDEVAPAGVDFVLGNPPYVRVESIPEPQNTQYRRLCRTMRGRADLYIGLYEAALQQLKPGGVCAFICADRWMMNYYGETLRRYLSEGFAVESLLDMHQTAAFEEEVSAYPAISVMLDFLSHSWPWYVAGPLIGLTVPALLLVGNKALGISSSLRHICAACVPARPPVSDLQLAGAGLEPVVCVRHCARWLYRLPGAGPPGYGGYFGRYGARFAHPIAPHRLLGPAA